MKKNKALAVPFVLWAVLFIAVPLAMVVWYGVTVEETPAYVEVAGDNGQTLFQLEDGTVTAERPQKRTVVSLANFRRMLEPTTSSCCCVRSRSRCSPRSSACCWAIPSR